MLEYSLPALAQERQTNAEARIRSFGAGDRLKEQIDWNPALEARSCVVMWDRQHALGRDRKQLDHIVQGMEDRPVASTESVAGFTPITASPQPNSSPSEPRAEFPPDVVAGMVWLDANSEHSALTHRVPASA